MRPIAIFQFSPHVEPGEFTGFLAARQRSFTLFRIDRGESVPQAVSDFSGICLMGGIMSVNDPLPWIPQVLELLRRAVAAEIPVIGHCLGGQLLSRALGGVVARNPVAEIGWGRISVRKAAVDLGWLDSTDGFPAFHWHRETFSLPQQAVPLMSSAHCENQAFAIGPHLGMQCHVEMTEKLIRTWNREWEADTRAADAARPSVQPSARQLAELDANLPRMRAVAHRLYGRWLENVRTD